MTRYENHATPKTARILAILLILATGLPAATLGRSREAPDDANGKSRTKRVEKTLEADGRTVSMKSTSASIDVAAATGDQIELLVELEYWSRDDDWMRAVEERFEVEIRESATQISIQPSEISDMVERGWIKKMRRGREVQYSLDITLKVPSGTPLELENRYGDIAVKGVGGSLSVNNSSGNVVVSDLVDRAEIENRYGDLTVDRVQGDLQATLSSGTVRIEDVTGEARISNRYGDVHVNRVGGDLELDNSSGKLTISGVDGAATIVGSYGDATIEDVGGRLTLELSSGSLELRNLGDRAEVTCSYGKVEIEGVAGELVLRSSSGSARIRDVKGDVRVDNSYGDVLLVGIEGDVKVTNPSGGVTLEGVTGDAEVNSSYAPVRVRDLGGSLRVSASSAAVSAENVGSSVEIKTSYSGVVIDGVGGSLDIRNQSGRVEVDGLTGQALESQHRIETTYADVVFNWPRDAALSFSADSTYGRIRTDFEATTHESGSRKSIEGSVGEVSGSSASVTISVRSGSVTLRED